MCVPESCPISGEEEKLKKLLPLAKKYGAMFILLPLSDQGLPGSFDEKIAIIEKITSMAFALGMEKEDIVVDGLVTTAGANPAAAVEVLETIRYCKQKGFATICGLSNISFGLPERSFVNAAFLTMAIREGLTMAIANPSQELLMNTAFATDLLLHKENSDIRYIEHMETYKDRKAAAPSPVLEKVQAGGAAEADMPSAKGAEGLSRDQIYLDVLKGNRKQIVDHTRDAAEKGVAASDILNGRLLPAISEVGDLFDSGKYFLPQLIASAEAMKLAIEYLEPFLLEASQKKDMPVVVIATVEGDIHDIGKNLVALMLKNYGFQVIDLGKDVPKEVIVEEAIKNKAKIIALSALMTTTMQEMKRVVAYAKEKGAQAKIMIGGAVITEDYAREIGADGYSRDAADAVKVAKRLTAEE